MQGKEGERKRGWASGVEEASMATNNHNSSTGVSVPSSHVAMAPGALLQDVDMADVGGVKPWDRTTAMATPVAAEDAIQNGKTPSAVPAGMQIYWNLSSLDMAVRESAAAALVQELKGAQDNFVANGGQGGAAEVLGAKESTEGTLEGCAPSVQYALRRLVRGLGSSRESARQGFAAALAAVVGALPVLKGEDLLRIISSSLEVTSSMKKQDAREGLLGRLFAYGAVIRAKGVIGNGSNSKEKKIIIEIIQQLCTLAKQKTFLREPVASLIIELARRLPVSAVGDTICAAPLFNEWLQKELENQNPEALLLALELHEKLPVHTLKGCSLLPESSNLQDIFLPSYLANISPLLKESTSSHPRVHSIWTVLLDHLLPQASLEVPVSQVQESAKKKRAKLTSQKVKKDTKDTEKLEINLANFWSVVVDGALLPSSHERKHLAMELLLLVLPRLPSSESVSVIMSNVFTKCIISILSSKDTHLHKCAQRCLREICNWAQSNDHHRVAVIVSLQKNSHGKFDKLSKTSTVRTLCSGLTNETSVMAFIKSLEELFQTGDPSTSNNSDTVEEDAYEPVIAQDKARGSDRIWIVEQMYALCRHVKLEPRAVQVTLYKEVMKFLILHSVFDASKLSDGKLGGSESLRWPLLPLSDYIRKMCADRLRSIIVDAEHWIVTQKLKTSKAGPIEGGEKVIDAKDFALFSALYCESIQKSQAAKLAQPLKEEDAATIKTLHETVSSLSAAVKTVTEFRQTEKLLAMRTLLSHLLLESYLSPGSSNDIAAELAICCSKIFPAIAELSTTVAPILTEDESEDPPPVMDVLLDLLLSLLAKSSSLIREASEKVFKVFCDGLTSAGITDILRIVNKGLKTGRHKSMIEGEDDESDGDDDDILEEDDENEGDLKIGAESKEVKEGQEDEDEDDDDEDDSDDDVEMDGDNAPSTSKTTFSSAVLQSGRGEDGSDDDEGSDSDVSDMDDEAMFRADALLANVLKHRKEANKTSTQTQLVPFKFRVLSLLEHFLQKHPSSSLVLIAVQGLLNAFVNSVNQLGTAPEESELFVKRLESILQSKVVKARYYPRGQDVDLAAARVFLSQTCKLASRSSILRVRTMGQGCTLWILKVILGNSQDSEIKDDTDLLQCIANALSEYFTHKKARLPSSFFAKIFQQHNTLGRLSIGQLVEKCGNARSECLKDIAMQLLSGILKPVLSVKGAKSGAEIDKIRQPTAHALESHLESLSAVLLSIGQKPPKKIGHKQSALRFVKCCIDAFIVLYPQKPLSTILDTNALLEGLKTIKTQKLQQLITNIEGSITGGAARLLVANENAANTKSKSLGAKKKKSADAEKVIEMDIEPTPSKKKKKSSDVEKVVGNVIESHIETDISLTFSKKKKMSVDVEKVIEVDIVPTPSKKKKMLVDAEKVVEVEIEPTPPNKKKKPADEENVVVEAEIVQIEQTPSKKKKTLVDGEKVVEVETEPTPPKKKKKSVDEENVVVEAEIVQIEQTPSKKKKQKERTSPKTQEMTGKKTKRCRVEQ